MLQCSASNGSGHHVQCDGRSAKVLSPEKRELIFADAYKGALLK